MNKKLIAAAVAASVAIPMAAVADVTVYGNITNAIALADEGEAGQGSTTDIDSVGSRLGVKASSDLGNGLAANGQFEWGTGSDNASQAFGTTRVATVGLSGSFGSVNVGQQWSSFFNTVGTLVSPNYSVGVPLGGPSARTGNTIQYSNSFGPVKLGIDVRLDDDEDGTRDGQGDGFAIGLTFNPTSNLTIGVAYDKADGLPGGMPGTAQVGDAGNVTTAAVAPTLDAADVEIFGIAAKATFGDFWISGGYQTKDQDDGDDGIAAVGTLDMAGFIPAALGGDEETTYYQLWVGTTLGGNTSFALGYGESEAEQDGRAVDTEMDRVALAINYDMGGGTHLFFETQDGSGSTDMVDMSGAYTGEKVSTDADRTVIGIRLNF